MACPKVQPHPATPSPWAGDQFIWSASWSGVGKHVSNHPPGKKALHLGGWWYQCSVVREAASTGLGPLLYSIPQSLYLTPSSQSPLLRSPKFSNIAINLDIWDYYKWLLTYILQVSKLQVHKVNWRNNSKGWLLGPPQSESQSTRSKNLNSQWVLQQVWCRWSLELT